jgi:hypothetical protein
MKVTSVIILKFSHFLHSKTVSQSPKCLQRYKYRNMVRVKNTEVKKYNHVRKYKEILHIWTVKQRHRKEIFGTKTINLYYHYYKKMYMYVATN